MNFPASRTIADNAYPAIAQGMPKVGHFARRSKAMFDMTGGETKR